jgi:flavin-binding protein dodecin
VALDAEGGTRMAGHVYKMVELVGSSPDGVDAAIRGAIDRAGETLRNLDWFEVKEIRGQIDDQQIAWFQVKLDIGFRVEGGEPIDD